MRIFFDGCLMTVMVAFIMLVVAVAEVTLDPSGLGEAALFAGSVLFAMALGLGVRTLFGDWD